MGCEITQPRPQFEGDQIKLLLTKIELKGKSPSTLNSIFQLFEGVSKANRNLRTGAKTAKSLILRLKCPEESFPFVI